MKNFIHYLKSFLKEHFNWLSYLATLFFCALLLYANYGLGLETELRSELKNWNRTYGDFLYFLIAQGGAYLISLVLVLGLGRKLKMLKSVQFFMLFLFGFLILAMDRSYHGYSAFRSHFSREAYLYFIYMVLELKSWVFLFIPLLILHLAYFKKYNFGLFGIRFQEVNFKPYFTLLLIMLPFVLVAAFTEGFQASYPIYPERIVNQLATSQNYPKTILVIGYELAYLLDFFTVELFFRGFLILGFIKVLGKEAVLPMAVTYCVLHFGKPMGEAISSIFGGYILGVFAYYSKNIWGGVFIHAGIAGLMELCAFLIKA